MNTSKDIGAWQEKPKEKPGQRAIVSNIKEYCSLTLFFINGGPG
jgi:hypothetical protein